MGNGKSGETNGVGLAGFIVSLIGIVGSCGILCPIGFVISLFGLKKEPRGFAIAGAIIGALGSIWVVVAAIVLAIMGVAAVGVLAAAIGSPDIQMAVESSIVDAMVVQYKNEKGSFPADLSQFEDQIGQGMITDPWDNPYRYLVADDGASFELWTNGPDGVEGTEDDKRLYPPDGN